jgi:hypothetical protein
MLVRLTAESQMTKTLIFSSRNEKHTINRQNLKGYSSRRPTKQNQSQCHLNSLLVDGWEGSQNTTPII